MVNRDSRYDLIKPMIASGKLQSFNDIFKYIPKTIVATDLGKKVNRFTMLMNRVEKFTLEELFMIAKFCELTDAEMVQLAMKEYAKNKGKIAKSPRSTKSLSIP
ncbi:MAG TPA: hypothetical protein VK563_11860 [Puia sp.]|nr:hypothetical protein [Puia sp.]